MINTFMRNGIAKDRIKNIYKIIHYILKLFIFYIDEQIKSLKGKLKIIY